MPARDSSEETESDPYAQYQMYLDDTSLSSDSWDGTEGLLTTSLLNFGESVREGIVTQQNEELSNVQLEEAKIRKKLAQRQLGIAKLQLERQKKLKEMETEYLNARVKREREHMRQTLIIKQLMEKREITEAKLNIRKWENELQQIRFKQEIEEKELVLFRLTQQGKEIESGRHLTGEALQQRKEELALLFEKEEVAFKHRSELMEKKKQLMMKEMELFQRKRDWAEERLNKARMELEELES